MMSEHNTLYVMAKQKLSFNEAADRKAAVIAYIRNHAEEITLLRFQKDSRIDKVESISLKKMEESWDVHGTLQMTRPTTDGTITEAFHFSCFCSIECGNDGEPVVSGLTSISNEGGY